MVESHTNESNTSNSINNQRIDTNNDLNNPLHLQPSDAPGQSLVNAVFDGRGFPGWRRSIFIALSAKNKLGFINGTIPTPSLDAPDYQQWTRCNNMVTSWILNSLSKDIGDSVMYSKTATQLWKSLEHRFGQSNGAKLFNLTNTRPDLSFAVLVLSQFLQNPTTAHYTAALRVVRYLRSDPGQGILLSSDPSLDLLAFCDADWASCKDTRRSVSGFYITLGGAPISWKSKKQISISLSSAEAEYRSMRRVTAEITWLVRLLDDLSAPPTLPVPIHSDSQAALHIAKNPVFHERTKHVELDCHFVRQQYLSGLITLSFVPSKNQLADLFTKALSGEPHCNILGKLGVLSTPSNLRGDVEDLEEIQVSQMRASMKKKMK